MGGWAGGWAGGRAGGWVGGRVGWLEGLGRELMHCPLCFFLLAGPKRCYVLGVHSYSILFEMVHINIYANYN
jgi:hypothetical protein